MVNSYIPDGVWLIIHFVEICRYISVQSISLRGFVYNQTVCFNLFPKIPLKKLISQNTFLCYLISHY